MKKTDWLHIVDMRVLDVGAIPAWSWAFRLGPRLLPVLESHPFSIVIVFSRQAGRASSLPGCIQSEFLKAGTSAAQLQGSLRLETFKGPRRRHRRQLSQTGLALSSDIGLGMKTSSLWKTVETIVRS